MGVSNESESDAGRRRWQSSDDESVGRCSCQSRTAMYQATDTSRVIRTRELRGVSADDPKSGTERQQK
ncbi:unnamed protein product [Leptosia nina]|uniref:Uncharacterized protein n=1 Tax=Leptosia nina TaxID=320188 RepID=A0AAV1JGP1_9NEOP